MTRNADSEDAFIRFEIVLSSVFGADKQGAEGGGIKYLKCNEVFISSCFTIEHSVLLFAHTQIGINIINTIKGCYFFCLGM